MHIGVEWGGVKGGNETTAPRQIIKKFVNIKMQQKPKLGPPGNFSEKP
jgi:hypothetical protein